MSGKSQPAYDAVAIDISTTDDELTTAGPCNAVFVGSAGNVTLMTLRDRTVLFTGCVAGSVLPVAAKKIFRTGTSAGALVALYTGI